ncbi:Rha family transcriptional regulator [uncultured Clostridium sp.]|uniref:Rha family transcriptional regulator n=1 Tax=uncultured Clostridium sp. TaxID=59620 RepID=UPI0025EC75A0|nr:Rha family transcriptional regulator [uncultured Clostridium sp.]
MNNIVFFNNQDKTKAITITNSLLVAEKFEKPHNDVLKSIRKLQAELGVGKISQSYYCKETTYTNSQNKKQPMFEFDRDFFTLLVMGFTGTKALKFKTDYINAFNTMEKELLHWNETRAIGKQFRMRYTDDIQILKDLSNDPNWNKFSFNLYSDLIYKKAFNGKTAHQLKVERNLQGKTLRSYLTIKELEEVNKWEDQVHLFIWKNKLYTKPIGEAYQEVKKFLEIA